MKHALETLRPCHRGATSQARIFIYSDGVYEVTQSNGKIWSQRELVDFIDGQNYDEPDVIDNILRHVRKLRGSSILEDDFTVVEAIYEAS